MVITSIDRTTGTGMVGIREFVDVKTVYVA